MTYVRTRLGVRNQYQPQHTIESQVISVEEEDVYFQAAQGTSYHQLCASIYFEFSWLQSRGKG